MDVKLIKRGNPTVELKNGDNPKINVFRVVTTPIYVDGGRTFIFTQAIASDVWTIEHDLGKRPSIEVVDINDNSIMGFEYTYIDDNNIVINFNVAISGKAYLN